MYINELNVAYTLHGASREKKTYFNTQYKKNSKLILNLISCRKFMRLAKKTTTATTKKSLDVYI